MPSNQDSSEQKLLKEFPEYGEGILSHCFKTTTLDEDGSELKMTALPIGFAVEWMKIIRNKAFDAGRAQGREEGETALARKVLSVAWVGNPMTPKGMTLRKRLNLLKEQMNKIIPDPFTPPKEQEVE